VGFFMQGEVLLGVEHHLGDAMPVPEIDKDDAAVVPAALHPSHQYDFLSDILSAQHIASMGSAHIS
jgi:hypothetical protein